MKRKWLTKTARTQMQSIAFFRDPFKLVPVTQLANVADVFSRNAILSSNELRAILGFRPSESDRANELINNNMPADAIGGDPAMTPGDEVDNPAEQELLPEATADNITPLIPETDPMDTPISALTG